MNIFSHLSANKNNAINIHVQVFCMYFISLEYIPKSEIACGYHNSLFNFQRNYQAVFQIDHAILHFYSCVLIFIHMCQNLFSIFLVTVGMK